MRTAAKIRVLTVGPEWAWALASGRRTTLRRRRPTAYRGTVLIHADSARPDLFLPGGERVPPGLPRAMILGAADIVDCERGRYDCAWVFARPRRFAVPIPCVAAPGFWTPPALTVSCAHCFSENSIEAPADFTCRRCGRSNAAPF